MNIMNKLLSLIAFGLLMLAFCAFTHSTLPTTTVSTEAAAADKIKWYTFEEAVELNKTTPKSFWWMFIPIGAAGVK